MLKLFSVRTAAVLAAAVALFAVVGFAASFAINGGDDIVNAEGGTLVIDCNDNGNLRVEKIDEWSDGTPNPPPGNDGWFVKKIKLSAYAGCDGKYFVVVLTNANGDRIVQQTGQLAAGTTDVPFDTVNPRVRVRDLHDIHVLISDTPQQ